MFYDRNQAGEILAEELKRFKKALVLAIPRGGVPVGFAIAKRLRLKLAVVAVRKLPIPWDPEAGFGAITADGTLVLNRRLVKQLGLQRAEIEEIARRVLKEVKRRERVYGRIPPVKGKTVILVDDGLASGYTMLAALKYVKKLGAGRTLIAAPVSSLSAYRLLKRHSPILCLHVSREPLFAVASFYHHFPELTDEEVLSYLKQFKS